MEDPIRMAQRLANSQVARNDQNAAAAKEWAAKVDSLVAYARMVVKPLAAEYRVLAAKISPLEIEIRFEGYAIPQQGGIVGAEEGAVAFFSIELDGHVYGFRLPARPHGSDLEPEKFVCLGEPATIRNETFGHAVCNFLEWGATGKGKSRYSTPK